MLETLLSRLLTRLLSGYVEGVTIETLRFGVWAGDLLLTDLRLRPDALDALQLPLSAVGRIGRLRIRVPWSRLRYESVRLPPASRLSGALSAHSLGPVSQIEITIEDVEVLARLRATPDPEAHARRERVRKRMRLDAHELQHGLRHDEGAGYALYIYIYMCVCK